MKGLGARGKGGRLAVRLQAIVIGLVLALMALPAAAAQGSHGLSAFGDLKYGPDFKHFDYVNPDAPKGGRLSLLGPLARITFDSFNAFILKGDAAQARARQEIRHVPPAARGQIRRRLAAHGRRRRVLL
jgi:ABC-type oligopeptide transport system substrate-binding subunit